MSEYEYVVHHPEEEEEEHTPIINFEKNPDHPELMSCPFCGAMAYLHKDVQTPYIYSVWCKDCGASSDHCSTEERAAQVWNRRV